ncbi:prepilin peptidase [Roseomonas sp. 18066]|uniref:prepilin peptidase n=1 Tax=Roseomonas sp. 18066 TaxID=2681412 RepID=UPI00135A2A82|nr:prepilin peptidase [Roseomonas sp. 18066]
MTAGVMALLGLQAGWALLCMAQDLRQRRIGNGLVLAGAGLALVALLLRGAPELAALGLAAIACLGLLLPWRAGVLGGGDVKLALVAALQAPAPLPAALALALLAALAVGLWRRRRARHGAGGPRGRPLPFALFLLPLWLALALLVEMTGVPAG